MKRKHFDRLTAAVLASAMLMSSANSVFAADDSAETKVIFSYDFEDGDVSDFCNRGENDTTVLSTDSDGGIDGKYLLASGRSKEWNGPAFRVDDKLEPNTEYYVSAKVKGKYYTNVMLSSQHDNADGETKYANLLQNISQQNYPVEDGWVTIPPVKFSFTEEMTNVYLYFEGGTDDLFIDDFTISAAPTIEIEQDIPGLKDVFANDFKVGTALTADAFSSKPTTALVEKHMSGSLTAGNEMKPDAVLNQAACQAYYEETGDDTVPQISFGSAKPFLNYCQKNNIPVRVHTLVWHSQTPDWFFKVGYASDGEWVDKETMLKRMENYIKAYFEELTSLYPDIDFYACDVVNEAWMEDGTPRKPGEQGSSGSSNSAWVQVFGDNSFIEPAFTYARKYAPEGCKLYYNDYNEYMDGKMNAIIEMATDLKAKGLIDGIGMQSHLDVRQSLDAAFPSVSMYNRALDKYAELGLDIQVTELDATTPENPTEADFKVQSDYYKGIWDSIYAHKDYISAVVIWGVTDDTSWRANKYPLLFDADYKAKSAFYSIIEGYDIPDVTNPPKTTEPPVTTTDSPSEDTLYGDANCDGKVEIADATLILQFLTNKDEYQLSDQGLINADVIGNGDGVTGTDALTIQQVDAGIYNVSDLPIKE